MMQCAMLGVEAKSLQTEYTGICVQVIELPIKHPELFESLGVAQPKVGTNTPISFQCRSHTHSLLGCALRSK